MAQKKKIEWKLWIMIMIVAVILSYYICGLVKLPGLTMENASDGLTYIFTHPFKNWWNEYTKYAILCAFSAWIVAFSYYLSNNKNFMFGREYGSAEWADIQKFNKQLADYDGKKKTPKTLNKNNRVLSQNARISYNASYTLLNNNQIIVGGSGAGKTAYQIAPNIFQFHGSNVYTDPKGDTLATYGKYMEQHGTIVKSINLCEMRESAQYNPFKYIRNQQDLQKLITNLIANTTPGESHSQDPFWEKAETLYLTSIFAYVWKCCPRDDEVTVKKTIKDASGRPSEIVEKKRVHLDRNFRSVVLLLEEAEVPANESEESPLTKRMNKLAEDPENKLGTHHLAVRNYFKCIRGAGDTVRSIIISANARFAPFDNEDLLRILDDDDIDLGSLGVGIDGDEQTRTALFCIIPDDDTTFNFVIGMLYTQLFQELYRLARYYGGKLPIDVGFWLDEFANIKMPDAFDKILATCRSRGIYCTVVLQNLAQIKADYEKKWESIIGNCDTFIYLGGNEDSTHEYISKKLGKWTIDKRSNGRTLGQHGSSSRTDDILGRELMTQDEVAHMNNDYCIVFVRGQNPIYDRKWFLWTSKEYKDAKALGEFHYRPKIEEDRVTGRLTTIKDTQNIRPLSKKSMEYYRGALSRGEEVEVASMSLVDFLSIDFDVKEDSQEAVVSMLLDNWDKCEEKLEERNDMIRKMHEDAKKFDEGLTSDSEVKEEQPAIEEEKTSTVNRYASIFDAMCDPSFEIGQLNEIRQGLLDGLSEEDVLKYAVVTNSAKKMAMMRKILSSKEAS